MCFTNRLERNYLLEERLIMPPRFVYWTIIAGGLPTAFRATEREELEPTFQRLREKHSDAEMKWFARGRLWASPEEARQAADEARRSAGGESRPRRRASSEGERPESRGRDWRPGGEHRDPRQKFKDAKKDRNLQRRKEKFARKFGSDARSSAPPAAGPGGEKPYARRPPVDRDRPRPPFNRDDDSADRRRSPRDEAARPSSGPKGSWQTRPPRERPHGDPLRGGDRPRPQGSRQGSWRDDRDRPRGPAAPPREAPRNYRDAPPSTDRKPPRFDRNRDAGSQPRGEWSPRPATAPKGDWRDRAPRDRPQGPPSRDRERSERVPRNEVGGDRASRPSFDRKAPRFDKPRDGRFNERGGASGRPPAAPRGDWRSRPPQDRPQGDSHRARPASPERPPAPPRGDWRDQGPRERPRGDQDRNRPPSSTRPSTPRGDWRDRTPRERPHGDPLRGEGPRPQGSRDGSGAPRDTRRPFEKKGFDRKPQARGFDDTNRPKRDRSEQPPSSDRPPRERRREDAQTPERPPRPTEPTTRKAPPERGGNGGDRRRR